MTLTSDDLDLSTETGTPLTRALGNICTSFDFSMFLSPYGTDGQTEGQTVTDRLTDRKDM